MATFDYDTQLKADTVVQSEEVKGEEVKGETPLRRKLGMAARPLVRYMFEDEEVSGGSCKTIWESFQRGVKKYPKNNLFGTRKLEQVKEKDSDKTVWRRGAYVWETYEEVNQKVGQLAAGLAKLGVKAGDNVGILSINRQEWCELAMALYASSAKVVPLYATLGENAVEYIIDHAELEVIATNKGEYLKYAATFAKLPRLKHIILFDHYEKFNNTAETFDEKDASNPLLLPLSKLRTMGVGPDLPAITHPGPDDMACIMYTSGTTGTPKGVALTHGNVVSVVATIPLLINPDPNDVHLSYLPLAHIFETVANCLSYALGNAIGFFSGDPKLLTDDLKTLRPTIMPGVPRVYTKMYDVVMQKVSNASCVKRYFFHKAYRRQAQLIREGRPRDAGFDRRVFKGVREAMGLDRVRVVLTGAAPCPVYILEFLKVVTGAIVTQGYGMTESGGAISLTLPGDKNVGHVGPPLPNCEVKLRDIPEMSYLSTDKPPRGELLVRGPCVFQGYYKDPESTAKTLVDGWLCTGDVARWNPNGTISIVDRAKNVFKLAIGEFVASEMVENHLTKSPLVNQVWVYGNAFKSFLVAVVVPSPDITMDYCVKKGWWTVKTPDVRSDEGLAEFKRQWDVHGTELKKELMTQLAAHSGGLKGFEKVKDVVIETDVDSLGLGFTVENNMQTPTFKLKRHPLLKKYYEKLKKLFEANGEPNAADEKWPGVE